MKSHAHNWTDSKRGAFEICSLCKGRFPCNEKDCAHKDCAEHRTEFKCHFCNKDVDKNESVTVIMRGGDYLAHACCRDFYNLTPGPDIEARVKAGYQIETCNHEFENKKGLI